MTQRIFVTGASGYLGGAIAARLARGAEVHGLTRSPKGATALERAGIRPVVGDLADCDSFLGALKNCDVAVHAAVDNHAWAERDQQAQGRATTAVGVTRFRIRSEEANAR